MPIAATSGNCPRARQGRKSLSDEEFTSDRGRRQTQNSHPSEVESPQSFFVAPTSGGSLS